jgi:hypothetical protein
MKAVNGLQQPFGLSSGCSFDFSFNKLSGVANLGSDKCGVCVHPLFILHKYFMQMEIDDAIQ